MKPIAHDAPPAEKVLGNELNLLEFWRYIVLHGGGAMSDEPDLFLFSTGIPLAFFNGVCHANLAVDAADDRIEFVKAWIRRRSVHAEWLIGPSSRPDDLGARLSRHGFVDSSETPGMDLDLLTLGDPPLPPEGVTIERARTREQLHSWIETSNGAFGMPTDLAAHATAVLSRLSPDDEAHARYYLAYLDGTLVGTSMLLLGGGVAGLYIISTLPQARHRGSGAALTLAPLHEARALGYGVAVLQASEMGYAVYRRIGFVERMRYRVYTWSPD